ncbi:MAG: hypothetical protein GX869_07640 [Candidatus Cloacimonetes bacterium]|nr:hypothetical protein [Candidatus Cloacimonadota bacterium]
MSEEIKTIKLIDTETPEEIAHLVEREDEKAILQEEMTGELLQALVYIGKDDKPVLSYAGVKEGARRFKNIKYGVSRVDETSEYFIAYGYAINLADNISIEVPKRQPKLKTLKTGEKITDEFAFEIACAKAIRNAIKGVIPIQYFQALVQKFLEQEPMQPQSNRNKEKLMQPQKDKLTSMQRKVHFILDRTGIKKDEDLQARVCKAITGKDISEMGYEELKYFLEKATEGIEKNKLLDDKDIDNIKQNLLSILLESEEGKQNG